jgi:hypothetical protein
VHEAAEYLGITRKNMTALVRRGRVVEPVVRLKCGPIWSESQLDEQVFHWRDNPRVKRTPEQTEQRMIARRLRILERRWQVLVETAEQGRRSDIRAVWTGKIRTSRLKQGLRASASPAEARHVLAEAKLLRLVADLRDKDEVFRGIADELDEAADLRERLDALRNAASGNGSEVG